MSSMLKPSPDCPVCNHSTPSTSTGEPSTAPKESRSSWRKGSHFKEHLSIITDLPNPVPVEKSAFSPDTPSSEYFHELDNEHDDPPTPVTIVGELPEELHARDDPAEPEVKQNYHHREQPVYIKTKATPQIPSPSPSSESRQHPRTATPPFVQIDPHYRHEQDLERNLPQTPHTTRTARSSRSAFSRFLLPFWTTQRDEISSQQSKEMYLNERYPPVHKDELPRHIRVEPRSQHSKLDTKIKPWNPLRIIKKSKPGHNQDDVRKMVKKRKKDRRRWCLIILIIILLFLLGDTVFLNVRVTQLNNVITSAGLMPSSPGSNPNSPTGSNGNQLSTDAQTCLTQFQLNAPSSPTSYSCSSCLPILQSVPTSFLTAPSTSVATVQNITNAIQFCSLKSVFDAAGSGGNNPLGNAGWLQDVAFCTWTGVTCGGDGKVRQLELDSPALPSSFPDQLAALSGLQSLKVIGNNQVPAGTIPTSFRNLTSLTSIIIQNTGLTGSLPDIFSGLKQLKTIGFQSNVHMQISFPPSLLTVPVQNLLFNSQPLTSNLSFFTTTPSSSTPLLTSLQILSLSNTSLTGPIPSLSNTLPNLTELHLGSNNLTLPLPGNFPPKLTVVDLSNNPGLGGASVPQQFCNGGQVKSCSLQGSGMTNACGNCQV